MKIFKEKIKPRAPVILTAEQLESVLKAHDIAGNRWDGTTRYLICACRKEVLGYDAHRRHQADEIARLQI